MTFTDQTLTCSDCSNEFVFTAGEQEFHSKMGFSNTPKRCLDCRAKKKAEGRGGGGGGRGGPRGRAGGGGRGGFRSNENRPKFSAECSECKKMFDAPFEPKPGRPIYCRECFEAKR